VKWDELDCVAQNTDIDSYIVSYGLLGEEGRKSSFIIPNEIRANIEAQNLLRTWEFSVAARGQNGFGPVTPFFRVIPGNLGKMQLHVYK